MRQSSPLNPLGRRGCQPVRLARFAFVVIVVFSLSVSGCLGIERSEWAFQITQITQLQEDEGLTGSGVTVGIVDSGIDVDHPALQDASVVAWRDFVGDRDAPYDDSGHGTHVAGILVAKPSTGQWFSGAQVLGVSSNVDLVVAKACGPEECSPTAVKEGIDFTVNNGADVIVLSLGGQQALANLGDAPIRSVERAAERGVYVVAAAGNAGTDHGDVESPSSATLAIAVGAVDADNRVADFSSRGSNDQNQGIVAGLAARPDPHKKPELVAPGVEILSTYTNGGYARASGTSQAAPFVAGSIALILEDQSQWKRSGSRGGDEQAVETMKEALADSALKLDGQSVPHDNAAGYGLVQALDGLKQLSIQ